MATILIIDDNAEFRTMVSDYFTDIGYKVEIAVNGTEGLSKSKQVSPDVIFLDVMMPDIGGIEVLRELQSADETRNIPVMVITGSYFDKNMNDLFKQESNCKEFLSKTTEISYIQKKVEGFVKKA